jgi:hypothetical protein
MWFQDIATVCYIVNSSVIYCGIMEVEDIYVAALLNLFLKLL